MSNTKRQSDGLVDWADLRQIANDLTNLEINTIVKKNLTGQKMPEPAIAVLQIANDYNEWLLEQGMGPDESRTKVLAEMETELGTAINLDLGSRRYAELFVEKGPRVFQALSDAAEEITNNQVRMEELEKQKSTAIPQRIQKSSRLIIELIKRYAADQDSAKRGEMIAGDALALRKIWEIGTQVVLLQTVIQLDGDVITYVRDPKFDLEDPILKLHQTGVQNATDSWHFLVKTVGSLARNLLDIFNPTGRL